MILLVKGKKRYMMELTTSFNQYTPNHNSHSSKFTRRKKKKTILYTIVDDQIHLKDKFNQIKREVLCISVHIMLTPKLLLTI